MAIGHPKETPGDRSKGRQAPIRWLDGRPDIGRAETRPGRGDRQEKQPKVIPGEGRVDRTCDKFEYTLVGPPMWIDVAIAFVVAVALAIVSDDAREEAG